MKDARVSLEARDVFFTSDDDPLSIISSGFLFDFRLTIFFFLLLLNLQQTNSEISILYNVYHL